MSERTELERDLYDFLQDADPSGANVQRLKQLLAPMSDKEFYVYMDKFFSDPNKYIQVSYKPLDNPVSVSFVEKLAKKHNIELYEQIYTPYVTEDTEDPPLTPNKMLVIDIPIKRLKQMVTAKNHSSTSNTKRDPKTGQVTGDDKTARVTDVEAYSLIVQELYSVAEEQFGPMADDEKSTHEMIKKIQATGEVYMDELPKDPTSRVTMNTINYMMLGSCITTNLIDSSGYMLPITLKGQEELKTIQGGN